MARVSKARPAKGAKGAGKGMAPGRKLAGRGGGARLLSMWSLLKAAVLLGAVAAFAFLLPFGGRTLADRWRAADGASDFAARTWAEMRGVAPPKEAPPRKAPARAQARAADKGGQASKDPASAGKAPGATPEEGVTEAERKQLERLLGEHLADAPKR